LFLDLDNFKQVNDAFGHQTGDAVLREIGRRLLRCVRNTDTVCRYGGDEFVIALTDLNDASYPPEIARKIKHQGQMPIHLQAGEVRVNCVLGLALYPVDGRDYDTLMARADASMYSNKRGVGEERQLAENKD